MQAGSVLAPRPGLAALAIVAITLGVIALLDLEPRYFNFGTETDTLGTFVPDARMLLEGRPMGLLFHPPLYSVALAATHLLVGDWMRTGLVISWLAAAVVLLSQMSLLRILFGGVGTIGGLLALATSQLFLLYSAQATSDLLFFAMHSLTLLLVALAWRHDSTSAWIAAGVMVGVACLTRSNGITLASLALAPLFLDCAPKRRFRLLVAVCVAMVVPLGIWIGVAGRTHSPVMPTKAYANLAMTYFGEGDRVSGESRVGMEERFSSIGEVLAYDPLSMARQYAKALRELPDRVFTKTSLLALPLSALAFGGLFLVGFLEPTRLKTLLLGVSFLQLLLVSMKTFEARFYLFALPWMGAAAALCLVALLEKLPSRASRQITCALLGALLLLAFVKSGQLARFRLHAADAELADVIQKAQDVVPPGSIVFARKSHVPFYLAAESGFFLSVGSIDALREALLTVEADVPVFLYFGSEEVKRQAGIRALRDPGAAPEWLRLVARGEGPVAWNLYRLALRRPRGDGILPAQAGSSITSNASTLPAPASSSGKARSRRAARTESESR